MRFSAAPSTTREISSSLAQRTTLAEYGERPLQQQSRLESDVSFKELDKRIYNQLDIKLHYLSRAISLMSTRK